MSDQKIKVTADSFGNTFLGFVIAICLLTLLFGGEPDIADAVRKMILEKAGLEYSNDE